MENLKIVSPWVNYFREIEAMFGDDPNIVIDFDEMKPEIVLHVIGADKADAITQLLPTEKVFGNVTLMIKVIPANPLEQTKIDLFRNAFKDNPAFSYAVTVSGISGTAFNYVVFKNRVVQYYNDDFSDVNGQCSTLYQEIAKDIFGEEAGFYFCTDTEQNFGIPTER